MVKNSQENHATLAAISLVWAQKQAKPEKYVVTTIDTTDVYPVVYIECMEQWE